MKSIPALLLFLMPILCIAGPHTYEVQHAGYAFDQSDEKGGMDFALFVREFRAFPWSKEVGRSAGGAEPTISVKNAETGIHLWVSVIGHPSEYAFLVGIVQPRQGESVPWVTAYVFERPEWVEEAFAMYFSGDIQRLNANLAKLRPFLDQKAVQ